MAVGRVNVGSVGGRIVTGSIKEKSYGDEEGKEKKRDCLHVKVDGLDFKPSFVIVRVALGGSYIYIVTRESDLTFETVIYGSEFDAGIYQKPFKKDSIPNQLSGLIDFRDGGFSTITALAGVFSWDTGATNLPVWQRTRFPTTVQYWAIE